jgi:hypothetical protein
MPMAREKDVVTKEFMRNNEVFADAVNYCIFNGQNIVKPEDLHELDTAEALFVVGEDVTGKEIKEGVQKYRDILKHCIIKKSSKQTYVIVGVENQTEINYAMPVKNMLYDAINYGNQVKELAKKNKAEHSFENNAEFLSGLKKTDRLIPVITITVCFNPKEWDGARSLHELLITDEENQNILKYVNDYKLNLIAAGEIKDFNKFSTKLGKVLEFIAASTDRNRLTELLYREKEFFTAADTASVELLNMWTGLCIKADNNDGKKAINVCKGLEDWAAEEKAEGHAEGQIQATRTIVIRMYKKGLELADIADYVNLDIDEVKDMIKEGS